MPLSGSPDKDNKCLDSENQNEIPAKSEKETLSSENITNEEDEEYDDACHTDTDLSCKLQIAGPSVPVHYEALSPEQIVEHMEDKIEQVCENCILNLGMTLITYLYLI